MKKLRFSVLSLFFYLTTSPILADDKVHLDLTSAYVTEHGNLGEANAVYSNGLTLSREFNKKLSVYFYGGDQRENAKSSLQPVVHPFYGSFVYNGGINYTINDRWALKASYDQVLGHNFGINGPALYHQIIITSNYRLF